MNRYPWRNTSEDIAEQTPSQWETPEGAQEKVDAGIADHVAHGTHPASNIIEDSDRRFVSDQEKEYWNEKADGTLATQTVKGMMSPEDKTKLDSATSDKLAGTLMRRDGSGRVKVAAPVAADDVARKQEVDTVQGNLNAHVGNTNIHITPAEHAKLAGIEAGAQVNQNAFGQINGIAATSESDSFTLVAGTGISIGADPIEKTLTINNQGESLPGPHAMAHVDGTDQIPNAVTGGRSGLMSGSDAQFVRVDGETKTGAQTKANTARDEAMEYADLLVAGITPSSIGAETPAGAQAKVDALAGVGNTKTVKQLDDEVTAHLAETAADGAHGLDATVAKFKAGNGTFTADDTSQTFTDAFCTATSLVTIAITSVTQPQGVWTVESNNGSFTITSTKPESNDITFDYYITKAVG